VPGRIRDGGRGHPRGRHILAAAILCAGWALVVAGPLSAAETFGPRPKPVESRCAPVSISAHLVNIGDTIQADAGPATANCGGPSSKVHWAWPDDNPDANQIPGLVKTRPCPGTSAHCKFRARLYSPAGTWEGICISGVAPQGAFTSCDSYAIRIGAYHYLTGTIFNLEGTTKVRLSGPGGRQSTETDSGGVWTFAVRNGSYTISFTVRRRRFTRHVKVHAKPGTSITVNVIA
jgi:hypothetical protein